MVYFMCALLKTSYLWPTTREEGDVYSLRERPPLGWSPTARGRVIVSRILTLASAGPNIRGRSRVS